jgi:hypothetical protein
MWEVEFARDDQGSAPVAKWMLSLADEQGRNTIGTVEKFLMRWGPAVCSIGFGADHGDGVMELFVFCERNRLGLFFHPLPDHVLLLHGAEARGSSELDSCGSGDLEQARRMLRTFRLEQERQRIGRERRG